jgi:hypothetical protein
MAWGYFEKSLSFSRIERLFLKASKANFSVIFIGTLPFSPPPQTRGGEALASLFQGD